MKTIVVSNVINLCLDGLTTDGGHHKQWALEEILKLITSETVFDIYKNQYEWEEGIAP